MTRQSQNFYKHHVLPNNSDNVRYSITLRCVHWTNFNSTYAVGDSNFGGLEFGSGRGKVGTATPGFRDWAACVKDIIPTKCAPYRNVVVMVWSWCGGVVVIRSPHDPEVPSSNPGKNNTSDFSIRDPLSLPSCDWYRIYLAMWWNSSFGRAADLIYTCQVRCHGFDSRCFPHI